MQESRHKQAPAGFTLIEVAVALLILVTAFGGIMSLIIAGQESKIVSRNNMVAAYLAEEGISLVRYVRNENYANSQAAFTGISDLDGEYYFFIDDRGTTSLIEAPSANVSSTVPLKLVDHAYRYSDDNNLPSTVFRRLVTTTYHDEAAEDYLEVKVEVYWQQDNKRNTVTLVDQLTDWH